MPVTDVCPEKSVLEHALADLKLFRYRVDVQEKYHSEPRKKVRYFRRHRDGQLIHPTAHNFLELLHLLIHEIVAVIEHRFSPFELRIGQGI